MWILGGNSIDVTLSVEPNCNPEKIRSQLGSHGRITSMEGNKLSINVPKSRELADSLDKLEQTKKFLGVSGFSVSMMSLEQVFLK